LEGLPAIVLGLIAYFFLTDRPRDTHWLKSEQKEWIRQKLGEQRPASGEKATMWDAFRSRDTLLLAGLAFLNFCVFYSFIFWMPTILKRLTSLADSQVGWLGTIPYLVCFVLMPLNGWHSDKTMERRWHIAIPMLVAAAGLFGLMGGTHSVWSVI